MQRLLAALDHALAQAPGQCEVCRQWTRGALCNACHTRFAVALPRCQRCALRLSAGASACGACLSDPPPFERCLCAVDYAFPWNRLVSAFKFQGRPELAATLATVLLPVLQAAGPPWPEAVLPVPLAPRRLAERGYNQAWELARRLARVLGLPAWPSALQRRLDTAPQAGLSRAERQRNLVGALSVQPGLQTRLAGRHLALVDDVMTTGATVREAASALRRAGAASVQVWVLARTPET